MPQLIGSCCVDDVPPGSTTGGTTGGSGGTGDASGKNEEVPFNNVAVVIIPWNSTRKARFGTAGIFYVEVLGDDGKYRQTLVQAVPDVIVNTTQYTLDLGGPSTGRVVIS